MTAILGVASLFLHTQNGGDPRLHHAATFALVVLVASAVVVWSRLRSPAASLPFAMHAFGLVALCASFVFQVYLGPFSPMTAAVVLGMGVFGLGGRTRRFAVYATIAIVAYAALGFACALDLVEDRGVFGSAALPRNTRVGMVFVVVSVYAAAAIHASRSRRAHADAAEEIRRVTREVKLREAQLAEAHAHIEVALGGAESRRGPWTGARVGDLELGLVVGRGAMSAVYEATHLGTGARAAVKLLHASLAVDADARLRFEREARVAAGLRSPHLVRVLDVGHAPDGAPYLAMELLEGQDLGQRLRRRAKLDLAEAVVMIGHVAAALDVAHAAGVVHRDLKPQNVFCDARLGRWKVLDFGVCSLLEAGGTLTGGALVGTPSYMAPEQARGARCDRRADVFAMGAVLYRAITGQAPFPSDPIAALWAVVHDAPIAPRELVPELPRDVARVLAIALAKAPDDRFDGAAELAAAFALAARGKLDEGVRARADALLRRSPWGHGEPPTVSRRPSRCP